MEGFGKVYGYNKRKTIKRSTLTALKFWLLLVVVPVYASFLLSTPQFSGTISEQKIFLNLSMHSTVLTILQWRCPQVERIDL